MTKRRNRTKTREAALTPIVRYGEQARRFGTSEVRDRLAGVLLGTAVGDALGAPYEFQAGNSNLKPQMKGGGGFKWEPGEWTDDTSMAICIAKAARHGRDLYDDKTLSRIVDDWVEWSHVAKDIGIQTHGVLSAVEDDRTADAARRAAREFHVQKGRSGGNGSLMRTAPVALRYLDNRSELAKAARAVSNLTHYDTDAGDACVLWSLAIQHAVMHGKFDLKAGLMYLPEGRRMDWQDRINEAEANDPSTFTNNGWVVGALQAAWSSIVHTEVPADFPALHLQHTLETAIRIGHDTDTVAAIAGGLLGARWGASAIPLAWQRITHGFPHYNGNDLIRLACAIVAEKDGEEGHWSISRRVNYDHYGDTHLARVRHPLDRGVWLGGVDMLDTTPNDVTAVVTLCRIGYAQRPDWIKERNHIQVWLLDEPDEASNRNLDFVLAQAADAVAQLRAEGHTVLLHCVAAHSRTPTVAALYAQRHLGVSMDEALESVMDALPHPHPNPGFRAALRRLSTVA